MPGRTKNRKFLVDLLTCYSVQERAEPDVGGPKIPLVSANAGLDYAVYWSECVLAVDGRLDLSQGKTGVADTGVMQLSDYSTFLVSPNAAGHAGLPWLVLKASFGCQTASLLVSHPLYTKQKMVTGYVLYCWI